MWDYKYLTECILVPDNPSKSVPSVESTSTMSRSAKNFEIAIVGGGVCGLAAAVALQKAGLNTEVFEAAVRVRT